MSLWSRIKTRIHREVYGPLPPPPEPEFLSQDPRFEQFEAGEWTYGLPTVFWHKPGRKVKFGRFCSIAPGVVIMLGGNHSIWAVSSYPFKEKMGGDEALPAQEFSKGDVVVGNDVWIGKESLIMSGVTIGDGAVVGARSVVTRNVSAYSIVAGNPARHVRYRVDENWIPALLKIAWWDWPASKITKAQKDLLSDDIEGFVQKYLPDGDR